MAGLHALLCGRPASFGLPTQHLHTSLLTRPESIVLDTHPEEPGRFPGGKCHRSRHTGSRSGPPSRFLGLLTLVYNPSLNTVTRNA